MVIHNNPTIAENATRILNSKQGEYLPAEVQGPIAVIPIENRCNIVRGATNNNSDSTLLTTPTDKDFYLCGAAIGSVKDATATSLFTHLTVVIDGVTQNLLTIPQVTLLVQAPIVVSAKFCPPIKIDRGTAIVVDNNTTTANVRSSGNIWGYTVETTK